MLIMVAKHVNGSIILQCDVAVFPDVACSDHCAIIVTLNFDQHQLQTPEKDKKTHKVEI